MKRFGPFKTPEASRPPAPTISYDRPLGLYETSSQPQANPNTAPHRTETTSRIGSAAFDGFQTISPVSGRPEGTFVADPRANATGFVLNPEYIKRYGAPEGSDRNVEPRAVFVPEPHFTETTPHVPSEPVNTTPIGYA